MSSPSMSCGRGMEGMEVACRLWDAAALGDWGTSPSMSCGRGMEGMEVACRLWAAAAVGDGITSLSMSCGRGMEGMEVACRLWAVAVVGDGGTVRNRTLTLIEREDDTRSWGNFLVYFSHSTTMSCPPRGWGYILISCQSAKNMLDASLRCQTRCCTRC
jgi:hypothetical protein